MPYTDEARAKGRESFDSRFANPADREAWFAEFARKGVDARRARRERRDAAIAQLRDALETLFGESFGGAA